MNRLLCAWIAFVCAAVLAKPFVLVGDGRPAAAS